MRNVLLDLDGTIADPKRSFVESITWALQEVGVKPPPPEVLTRYIGPPLEFTIAELLGAGRSDLTELARRHYFERYREVGVRDIAVYPNMPDAIRRLAASGRKLWVCTSKAQPLACAVIQASGLAPYFEGIYGSQIDGTRVDKADILAHLLKEEALRLEDTALVGDRSFDVMAGHRNGIRVIGVTWGYGSEAELNEAGVATLVRSPEELVSVILGANMAL